MSKKLQLSRHGHDENDEDSDIPTTKHFHHGDDENDEESSSTKQRQNGDINKIAKATIRKSKAQHTTSIIGMTDTFDRPPNTIAEGGYYAKQGSYALGFKEKSGIFEVEAKGPNASYDSEFSVGKVEAMARVEVASASAKAGPVGVKVGLGFDTGASAGEDGVEAKFLGTGFSIGPKNSISLLGSEVSCSVM